jgi:hypothetical protein
MSKPTKSWSSKFGSFFRTLACIPADIPKNVEEVKPSLNEVVRINNKSGPPENDLDDEEDEDAVDTDQLNDQDEGGHFLDGKGGVVEACLMVTPLILGVFYSYLMIHLTTNFH